MKALTCEGIRELLPERDRDSLDAPDRLGVDEHLAVCADCRADLELIGALRADAAAVRVPVGLETRVVNAVRRPPIRRAWVPAHLAIAASIVLALLAGGALLRDGAGNRASAGVEPGDAVSAAAVVGPSVREPLLRGVPALHELSVEELEVLLSELES